MPDDSVGSFPTPQSDQDVSSNPSDNAPTIENSLAETLTDPVAPDLSSPPPSLEEETPKTNQTTPLEATPPAPPKEPPPAPATFTPKKPFPLTTLLLGVVAIGAIALTSFFYLQTQSLGRQLTELSQTLQSQKISPTPTPTITITPTPTEPIATISAEPTPIATPSPTPILSTNPVFGNIQTVLTTAQSKYPNAQLIMITASYVQPDNQLVIKYWFRQDEQTKKYLYILKDNSPELAIVDQQVYVTPDNSIPSLNSLITSNSLGLDLDAAVTLARTNCPTTFDCTTAQITGQFIKTTVPVWQLTFRQANSTFVIQIDSNSQKILYKSQ